MERSTVIGKEQWSVVSSRWSVGTVGNASSYPDGSDRPPHLLTTNHRPLITTLQRGFTLLELMIVISIIVILAVIAMPQYQKTILHTRETVLRDNLYQLRKAIDLYGADKGKLPQSLDDLATAVYVRDIPIDPVTGEKDWTIETGEDSGSLTSESGITNIRSASPDTSTEGTPYREW
ncbi:MAG: type II secretion system protein [Acidobacteria bacterium]|nr:type II secretion system protein [Acidobacteriota bacterium]